jgi:tetratricopeptide (TPR) repeat protein
MFDRVLALRYFTCVAFLVFAVLVIAFWGCGIKLKTATEYLIDGNEYFKAGEYKKAEANYKTALKLAPASSTAMNNLGVILNEEGHYDEAIQVLKDALKRDPKNAIAHYVLASALTKKGLYDEATAHATTATQLDPTEAAAYRALAEAAIGKSDYPIAIQAYHAILALEPDNDIMHHRLAIALGRVGDADTQILEEKKAISLNEGKI